MLLEDVLKLKYLKGSDMPLLHSWGRGTSVAGIQAQCVRLGMLLEVKFHLLCFEMLTKAGWHFLLFNQLWADLFVKPEMETSFWKS